MKHPSSPIATFALLGLFVGFFGVSVSREACAAAFSAEDVLRLSNRDRMALDMPPLRMDSALSSAARAKAGDIIEKEYFAHTSPEGKTPWYFFDRAGYRYRYAGENLAIHFASAESEQLAWMKSEKHRENILSAKYRDTGIAVADMEWEGKETTVTVQLFGTRLGDVVTDATPWKSLSDTSPAVSNVGATPISDEAGSLATSPSSVADAKYEKTIEAVPSVLSEFSGLPYDTAMGILYGCVGFLEFMALGVFARMLVSHSRIFRLRITSPM